MQDRRKRSTGEGIGLLSEYITREEVVWALQKLKMKAAAGKDGITALMMNREVLVELWWELFNWCLGNGMVPSMWKSSMVVPVPIKDEKQGSMQYRRVLGISLV